MNWTFDLSPICLLPKKIKIKIIQINLFMLRKKEQKKVKVFFFFFFSFLVCWDLGQLKTFEAAPTIYLPAREFLLIKWLNQNNRYYQRWIRIWYIIQGIKTIDIGLYHDISFTICFFVFIIFYIGLECWWNFFVKLFCCEQ